MSATEKLLVSRKLARWCLTACALRMRPAHAQVAFVDCDAGYVGSVDIDPAARLCELTPCLRAAAMSDEPPDFCGLFGAVVPRTIAKIFHGTHGSVSEFAAGIDVLAKELVAAPIADVSTRIGELWPDLEFVNVPGYSA
ncbi:hypothetical protein [Achromobacter spanius]|uniref:hypothetical protein n=1 Tax=Achromobacter spanius TaxID=217203 RepID=UPI003F690BF0